MSSIYHSHSETKMAQVLGPSEPFLSVQYLIKCLDPETLYHQDGTPTEANERDTLHQTPPNRVTVANAYKVR